MEKPVLSNPNVYPRGEVISSHLGKAKKDVEVYKELLLIKMANA